MNKEKNFVSAVVYVYNAEKYIANYLQELICFLENHYEHSEVICVNDSSNDDSAKLIKALNITTKNVTLSLLNMSYFHGMEVAMNAGVDFSIGDYIMEIDKPNRDYELEELFKAYDKVLEGNDIVSVYANKPQSFTSKLFYKVYEHFSANHSKLHTESFRILSRRALNRVSGANKRIQYRKILYANCGLKTASFAYEPIKTNLANSRDKNISSYRSNLATDSLIMFTDAGYTCAKWLTGLMLGFSLLIAIYTIAVYCSATPVAGWASITLFMAFAFSGLFAVLAIIIKYLQILLDLTFKRKKYSFEAIEKITK